MITVLLDENKPFDLITLFEKFNFLVYHIKKLGKAGAKNGEVYTLSNQLNAWIITRDSDFDSLLQFQKYNPTGVIVVETRVTVTSHLVNLFEKILERQVIHFDKQQLIVLDDNGITVKNNY